MTTKKYFVLAFVSLFAICVLAGCGSRVSVPDAVRCANNWKKQGYSFDPNSMTCSQMSQRVQATRRAEFWREKGYLFDPNTMTRSEMDQKAARIERAEYWKRKKGYDFDPNTMTARQMEQQALTIERAEYWKRKKGYVFDPNTMTARQMRKRAEELDKIENWKELGYYSDPNSAALVKTRRKPNAEADEPNDVPPVVPPVLGVELKRTAWDIGPEAYYFKYDEPGIMEEEGIFYGVRFGYTFREWAPSSPEESSSDGGAMFRAEGRLAAGQVDYDGQTQGGTPYTIDNIDDFVFEGRLLLGADMLNLDTLHTLYTGIGYRYLNDDSSFDPGGYERESNYLYVPLGYQFDSSDKVGWSWGFNAEFDFLIVGHQRSHLSDLGPAWDDVENRQESGYGCRASVRFQHKSNDALFVIEPFFRYWDIDQSEVAYDSLGWSWIEPANETTEVGIQLFWMF